ncbi:MAG: hypothetical protein V3V09_04050 [Arenicellales bacterium]
MIDSTIPDFSGEQIQAVQALINKRYGEEIELHLGDGEVQLDIEDPERVDCPLIIWNARDCNYIISRTGEHRYIAQFFYNPKLQYSTNPAQFAKVEECVLAVLQAQCDFELESEGVPIDSASKEPETSA